MREQVKFYVKISVSVTQHIRGNKKVSNIYFFGLLAKMNIAIAQSLKVQILTKFFRFLKNF